METTSSPFRYDGIAVFCSVSLDIVKLESALASGLGEAIARNLNGIPFSNKVRKIAVNHALHSVAFW